jgi:hypothetical protein
MKNRRYVVWIRLYAQLLTMLRILRKHLLNAIVHQLMMIDDDSNNDDDSHDPDDPLLVDIAGILANDTDNDDYNHLPIHHKCVCHSLNLITTTDADNALQTQVYSKIYHTS